MTKLSAHFSEEELRCRCGCGALDISNKLLVALEWLRTSIGNHPIAVHSGRRCGNHNSSVGGTNGSFHLFGLAADVHVPDVPLYIVYAAAIEIPYFRDGGIGLYYSADGAHPFWLHLDVRDGQARWGYINREKLGIEPVLGLSRQKETNDG